MPSYATMPSASIAQAERPRDIWYTDLPAITLALAIFGFPFGATASTWLGTTDNTLTVGMRAITFGACAMLIIRQLWRRKVSLPDISLFLFAIAYTVRLVWDFLIVGNEAGGTALLYFGITVAAPTVALASVPKTTWNERSALIAMLTSGAVCVLVALWSTLSGQGLAAGEATAYALDSGGRLGLERLNPIALGHMAVSVTLISFMMFQTEKSLIRRLGLTLIGISALYLVLLSASRGPLIALFVSMGFIALTNGRIFLLTILLLSLFIFSILFSVVDINSILDVTRFSGTGSDANSISRLDYFGEALDVFYKSPLVGGSFEMPISGGYPHNFFIEILMATGVAGFILIIRPVYRSIVAAFRLSQDGGNLGAVLLFQSFVGLQFSGSLWGSSGWWIAIVMVLGGLGAQNQLRAR